MGDTPGYRSNQSNSATSGAATTPLYKQPAALVVAIIAVVGVIAGISTLASDDTSINGTTTETAFAEALGGPLPPFSDPLLDPAVGAASPVITASTIDGERVQYLHDDGQPRLFAFFAHWCPVCQAELPEVVEWLEADPLPEGMEIVAISTAVDAGRDNYPPSAWFEAEGWENVVLVDSDASIIAQNFGLTGFPYWVAVEADGNVAQRVGGAIDQATFLELIETTAGATQ